MYYSIYIKKKYFLKLYYSFLKGKKKKRIYHCVSVKFGISFFFFFFQLTKPYNFVRKCYFRLLRV